MDRGGGLLTGIRKTIPYKSLEKFNIRGEKDHITEGQAIEIPTQKGQKIRITNIYVPRTTRQRLIEREEVRVLLILRVAAAVEGESTAEMWAAASQ